MRGDEEHERKPKAEKGTSNWKNMKEHRRTRKKTKGHETKRQQQQENTERKIKEHGRK